MPKVTRIVFSGSRPISGRSVTICMRGAEERDDQRQPATSASQKFPVAAMTMTPT